MSDPEAPPKEDDAAAQGENQDNKSEKPKSESKSKKGDEMNMSQASTKTFINEIDRKIDEGAFMCCCCLCECRNKQTKGLTCCCILPIKCGVYLIGAVILLVTLFAFLEIFYELLNDDIHWWYVFVAIILSSLLLLASAFVVVFFTKDDEKSRPKLWTACLFVIIGVSLMAVWCTCYFLFWYKKDSVVTGNDGVGFVKATRKQQIVINLYVACLIDALFAYFLCIVSSYQNALDKKEEPEEDGDAEEKEPLNKDEEQNPENKENKDDPPPADGDAPPADGDAPPAGDNPPE